MGESVRKFKDGKTYRLSGWGTLGKDNDYRQLVKDLYFSEGASPEIIEWLDSLSDNQIESLIDPYWNEKTKMFGMKEEHFDEESLLKDLQQLSQFQEEAPEFDLDLDALDAESQSTIDAEINEMLGRLDEDKTRQTGLFENQLKESNAFHGNALSQLMSRDYQNNAQLSDSMQSEMSRSRRNALEAGASAGLRLAENINVTLSAQNRQSQQSLETSNNLAQLMLNQRQASAGIRGDYGNYMSGQTNQRNNITGGRAERVESFKKDRIGSEREKYKIKKEDWEDKYNTAMDSNSLAEPYRAKLRSQYNEGG